MLMIVETILGTIRVVVIVPLIGQRRAKRLGFGISLIALFITATCLHRWMIQGSEEEGIQQPYQQIGLLWATLTVCFEIAIGRLQGFSWRVLADEFNPMHGSLMTLIGLPYMLILPQLVSHI